MRLEARKYKVSLPPLWSRFHSTAFSQVNRISIQNPPVNKEKPANHPTAEDGPAVAEGSLAAAEGNPAAAEDSLAAAEGNPAAAEDSLAAAEGSLDSLAAAEGSPVAAYFVHIAERQEA